MDFIGKQPCISRFSPVKMQAEYPKHFLYFDSDSRKYPIPSLLFATQRSIAPGLSQYPVKLPLLSTGLLERLLVISLVGKYGLFMAFYKLIHHLRIVNVSWGANKFRDKLRLWIYRNMILVTVNGFVAFLGKGGIVIFARASGRFDQTGINDLARAKFKALLLYLALEFGETFAVKVHGLEVKAEARDSGIVRDGVNSGKSKEAAIEEVTLEHEFHFGVRMAVDLLDDKDFEHHDGVI